MYDNENGFDENPKKESDNIEEQEVDLKTANADEMAQQSETVNAEEDAHQSEMENTGAVEQTADTDEKSQENESSVYRQSYVNNSEHNTDNINEGNTYYSQSGSYYNSYGTEGNNTNDETKNQNTGYYYSAAGSQPDNNDKKKKNKKKIAIIVAIVVVIGLFAGTVAITLPNLMNDKSIEQYLDNTGVEDNKESTKEYEIIDSTDTEENVNTSSSGVTVTDVSGVVENTMPSVVAITSKTLVESSNNYTQDIWEYYFGGGNDRQNSYEEEAAGSGIIVDQTSTELLIVTNNHVVEGADSLKIQFNDTESDESIDGYIKGTDSTADVAVVAVKLEDIPSDVLKNIKKATLGDSDKVKVGEGVIAIGNALGYGQSVTTGIISAKDRLVELENQKMTLLQTDAAINGGNSGGALLNANGEVIGINVAKYSSSGSSSSASVEGMGFAIPISSVKSIISNLETKETRTKVDEDERGYLGISGFDVDEQTSVAYSIPKGIQVQSVVKGGPAEKAGIVASDVITKFDGQDISSMTSLQNMLEYYKKGEKVTITIAYRDGREYKEKDVTVTLGDKSLIETMQDND